MPQVNAGAFLMSRSFACTVLACLATITTSQAQVAPGFGYATDTDNRIVSVNLATGATSIYNGQTVFPANAMGYSDGNGAAGSVIYSSNTTAGELGVWNRATNTHTDIGNITSTSSGYTNPYPAGAALSDAAYWDGTSGPPAGYYVVTSNRAVYRVDFNIDNSTDKSIVSIANVTLVGTVPVATTTTNLTATFAFGDIAFNPASGVLYLSDSNNGLFTYTLGATTATKISTRYDGQIAFGVNDLLYGVGNSAGAPNTQGNDFYQISLTDGTVVGTAVLNTDAGYTYRDFSGAAAIDIVPEPGTPWLLMLGCALAFGTMLWRRSIGSQVFQLRLKSVTDVPGHPSPMSPGQTAPSRP